MSTLRQLGKGALIYGLQPVLTRLVSILMLPLYTRLLTPEDYGVLQLLDTTAEIAAILFTAGAIAGVQRFYFKYAEPERQKRLLATAQVRLLLLALVAGACLMLLAPVIHRYALRGSGTPDQVRLSALSLASGFLSAVPLLRLQLQQRAAAYSSLALARLILQLSLNIVLVALLRLGVTGILLSTITTNLVVGGALSVSMFRSTGVHWDRDIRTELSTFGRPYRLTGVGSYVLNFGDRFFLSSARGAAVVGTYGLAYQFGFGFAQFFCAPISRAWDPIRYQLATELPEVRNPIFLRVFNVTNVLLFSGFVLVVCFIRPLVQLLTTPAFYSAASLVPIIVAAYLVQFWTEWFTFQINISEKTQAYSRATILAAVVTLGFYTLLIPRYGAAGAAWATFGGFTFRMLLAYRSAQTLWPIPYKWGPATRLVVMALSATFAARVIQNGVLLHDVVCGLLLFSLFATGALVFVVDATDRRAIGELLVGKRSLGSFIK